MRGNEEKEQKKRVHNKIPTYKKFYSVYQFDWNKYSTICKKLQQLALKYDKPEIYFRVSPYNIQRLCYIRDEFGFICHQGDQRHIFRYKTLESILENLANVILDDLGIITETIPYMFKRTGMGVFQDSEDYRQAELLITNREPIKHRILIHITLLRCLKAGFELEEAIEYTELEHKAIFESIRR